MAEVTLSEKALICFPHGLGDVIMFTPCLRELHEQGFVSDMMVRPSVINSQLLDHCPYTDSLIVTRTDTRKFAFEKYHRKMFDKLKGYYQRNINIDLNRGLGSTNRLETMAELANLRPSSWQPEVFISLEAQDLADAFIASEYGDTPFVFIHTITPVHPRHNWNCSTYLAATFPDLPYFFSGKTAIWPDINVTFAVMKAAAHRVLSLSVMYHAADALGCTVDIVNYGVRSHPSTFVNKDLVKRIIVEGQWKG